MKVKQLQNSGFVFFLLHFFLYEDFLLSVILSVIGLAIIYAEKISREFMKLEWREYVFFIYMFYIIFGEREFAYLGLLQPFVTKLVLGNLILSYARELLSVRKVLVLFFLLVLIGILLELLYFFEFK